MRIIKTEGHSKLVEYQEEGKPKRVILPVNEHDTNLGIPYGYDFANSLKDFVCSDMAQRIENELHRTNLWTLSDILNNPAKVQGAILAAYAIDYSFILQLAKKEIKDGR